MNLYGYGDGDPINNSDPFGLWAAALVRGAIILATPAGRAGVERFINVIGAAISAGVSGAFSSPTQIPGYAGTPSMAAASDATAVRFAGRGRSKNDIPLTGGPPGEVVTKPGSSVLFGPDGNAVTRTCAGGGHGCEGAHTHEYVTGPNGKVNQKGQPRPATEEEIKRTPPPNKPET